MVLTPETVADWNVQRNELNRLLLRPGGTVHLIGVGGIGMAGVALHLRRRGFEVSGSDLVPSRITKWLRGHGIRVCIGHQITNVPPSTQWIIKTPAVSDRNLEVEFARTQGISVYTRGVVLSALLTDSVSVAVSGTHGKTTTAGMIAYILRSASREASHCIGGEMDELGGVAVRGVGSEFVVEADESDGTLVLYRPDIAVLTNMEYDHMEHFPDSAAFFGCFRTFAHQSGRIVYCADDEMAREVGFTVDRSLSYGSHKGSDVRISEVRSYGGRCGFRLFGPGGEWGGVELSCPGAHNALNAAGAAAASWCLGVDVEHILRGIEAFRSARRRFESVVDQRFVKVVSDYAHHPTEICAVLKTASSLGCSRIVAVFQPHRYTRTQALMSNFATSFEGVDQLILTPVYAASEKHLEGGTSKDLYQAIQCQSNVPVRLADSLNTAWQWIREGHRMGDLILILGAGDVDEIAGWAEQEWGLGSKSQ